MASCELHDQAPGSKGAQNSSRDIRRVEMRSRARACRIVQKKIPGNAQSNVPLQGPDTSMLCFIFVAASGLTNQKDPKGTRKEVW